MPTEEAILGGAAAAGTLLGTLLGAFGMKKRTDLAKEDLVEEVKALSQRIIRLEVQLDELRDDRVYERDQYTKLILKIDTLCNQMARIEAICNLSYGGEK